MCYHKSQKQDLNYLADYYSASYAEVMKEVYQPNYHENGFDFLPSPVLTSGKPTELQLFHWGMIPFWVKDLPSALKLRVSTLNCISEEMFDKPSFRDAAKEGKRCLIPCSGFYEWRWLNPDDKKSKKYPYFIHLRDQPLFSLAGLYARWTDRTSGTQHYTYTVLTTKANQLMDKIHNTKKRMPVIIPRNYEKDWLNPNLTKDDVLALCQPYTDMQMDAYTISKRITSKTEETNVPEVQERELYPELNSD
jgi:putative SOS response-associated peptidase YedK